MSNSIEPGPTETRGSALTGPETAPADCVPSPLPASPSDPIPDALPPVANGTPGPSAPLTLQTTLFGPLSVPGGAGRAAETPGPLPPRRALRHPRPRRRHPARLPLGLAPVRGLVCQPRPRTARRRSRHPRHVRGALRRCRPRGQLDPRRTGGDPNRPPAGRPAARSAPSAARHGDRGRHPGNGTRPRSRPPRRCPACCG